MAILAGHRAWNNDHPSPKGTPMRLHDVVVFYNGASSVICRARIDEAPGDPEYVVLLGFKRKPGQPGITRDAKLGDLGVESLGTFQCTTTLGMRTITVARVQEAAP